MDISTLSKQLNIPAGQLRAKMNAAGFYVSPRANKIDNYLAKQVLATFRPKVEAVVSKQKEIKLPNVLTVKELALKLGLEVSVVIKKLIENGVLASINEEIDYDTAAVVAHDLGFNVLEEQEAGSRLGAGFVMEAVKKEQDERPADFVVRPPVVAIMGHVDHGKTTLLDTIRKTRVVEEEAGRITQHIGAYQVEVPPKEGPKSRVTPTGSRGSRGIPPPDQVRGRDDFANRKITFLDTPGHEAFAAMRARGANVTDIIVLVVAADDGVKPQTIEVINRARFTDTPLIVAINKIDKPDANIERVKKELSDYGVVIEEWGGKVPVAKISAQTGHGVDDLLDLILLQAEVLDLKAHPSGQTLGTVIESRISKTLGSSATVLVQNGTLHLQDVIAVGKAFGKVRTMLDAKGARVKFAAPATPVMITGFSDLPQAGDILKTYLSADEAKAAALIVAKSERAKKIQGSGVLKLESQELNLIIKADVAGSIEAINEALSKLKNTEVKLNLIEEGVGEINENDILRAASASAAVIGFHTRLSPQAAKLAQSKKVTVQLYDVIYELVEDLTRQVVEMLIPEVIRTELGKAKILAVFRTEKEQMIVGGRVIDGKIQKLAQLEIMREGQVVGKGQVLELQQNRMEVKEVLKDFEFGLKVKTDVKIQVGDILVVYEESVRKKSL